MSSLFFAAFVSLVLTAGTIFATNPPVPLSFDPARTNDLSVRDLGDGSFDFTTAGGDPFVVFNRFDPEALPASHTILDFEYSSADGVQGLEVFYGPTFSPERQLGAGSLEPSESWTTCALDLQALSRGNWTAASRQLRLDLGKQSGVTLRIRNPHLRAPTETERRARNERRAARRAKIQREARINAFYKTSFAGRIDSVTIDDDHVIVRAKLSHSGDPARLVELHPEVSIGERCTLEKGNFFLDAQPGIRDAGPIAPSGPFERALPRMDGSRDRTTSRWAVADALPDGRWRLRSHWKYATDLGSAAEAQLPRATAPGIKGMGGVDPRFPLPELVDLGVHHITINIDLVNLMDTESRPGWTPFVQGGRTWFVNPGALASYDRLAKFAEENEIVASGILLARFSNSSFAKTLIHPEADRAGHYAMVNLTNANGVATYEAVIEFLASRYAQPGFPHGRIANWIIHNEIGYGWVWTNMGEQPPMLYMDHYLRSMRLVHNVTRRHDPHSRVFISLTHHWNTPGDSDWKTYSNRDLVARLTESSRVEGDFAWGLAFHPYPENLREPDTWNDQRVTDDFDTPLITPKNIEVLDRLMHRPEMLDRDGKVRGVLLSEQGFNTPDYSEQSQRLQAAALVYTWKKLREMQSVEAFHYHRWVDHPHEEGLLLGLRKLPADGRAYGDRKLAWKIYQALGTDAEAEAREGLSGHWSDGAKE